MSLSMILSTSIDSKQQMHSSREQHRPNARGEQYSPGGGVRLVRTWGGHDAHIGSHGVIVSLARRDPGLAGDVLDLDRLRVLSVHRGWVPLGLHHSGLRQPARIVVGTPLLPGIHFPGAALGFSVAGAPWLVQVGGVDTVGVLRRWREGRLLDRGQGRGCIWLAGHQAVTWNGPCRVVTRVTVVVVRARWFKAGILQE